MDFDLSEDQLALRDGARALLDDLAAPPRIRRVAETPERVDRDLWTAMVDQGWLGIAVPEAEGGVGLGPVELGVLLEEVGRHVAPAPFLPTVLALDVHQHVGAPVLHRLERPDGTAELHALLRVLHRHLEGA